MTLASSVTGASERVDERYCIQFNEMARIQSRRGDAAVRQLVPGL